jgi:AcrR family transcriptional regulator
MTDLDDLWPPTSDVAPRRAPSVRAREGRRTNTLSREEIVQTAMALADAEGAGAVNMRRIGRELETGAMSLYWHVTDKDQLVDLMLDAVEGEDALVELTGEWREDLGRIARQRRRALLRHPWVVDFMSGRPPYGPNALLQIERTLSVLDGLDLDTQTALRILTTVDTYVTGSVLHELREARVAKLQSDTELTDVDFATGMRAWRDRLDRSGLFTRVVRVFDEGIDPDALETRDERFEFGLDCVLSGVASRLPEAIPPE